ncbi:dTMP kinase [Spirochaeta africana]|uniref:Thymidylate kinase n=1 Tax=Spirochaeta africana (strain ATCC 700263 / DSM 8902 / Z-7692) TaxID=889378 RepID=H9UJB4_SPIAZ|nr:dTMP kinase [Spirochaeta africana]AFG37607.1 thymidylate kinase [Spirochaeta africana DSM 8902]
MHTEHDTATGFSGSHPRFIVLEGIDGAGTTTQAHLLARALAQAGEQVYATCEPTDGSIGRLIRTLLSGTEQVTPHTMAHLFAADRCEHVYAPEHGIVARLARGDWVISDRYVFSSLAYQGPDVGFERVRQLNSGIPLPRWVFHLSLSGKLAMSRLSGRSTLDIYENTAFQDKVSHAYSTAYQQFPQEDTTWQVLDATDSVDKIHRSICNSLEIPPINTG